MNPRREEYELTPKWILNSAHQADQLESLRNRVLIFAASVTVAIVLIALLGVPFWISNGTFGRTFLDKPGFIVVAVNLSKNGTDCYIRSTVSNTGNIYINRLTLSLNSTYVFSDGRRVCKRSEPERIQDARRRILPNSTSTTVKLSK